MSRRAIEVHVSPKDLRELRSLLRAGIQQVRVVLRAIALEQLAAGLTAPTVSRIVHLSPQAVRQIAHRYLEGGLERALYEHQGRGAKELLEASEKQRIIAMVCSQPPEGQARWTVRLIAEEAVKRKLIPRVGRETIRVLLLHHEFQPWREKNVVRGPTGPRLHRKDGGRLGDV
jgi:transposase